MARTPEYKVDEMRRLLKQSGWYEGLNGWTRGINADEAAKPEIEKARTGGRDEGRRMLAAEVIKAYGLAESYPDITEEREGWRMGYDFSGRWPRHEPYTYKHVIPGSVAFIEDLKTVAESRDVAEASKRLGLKK